MKLHQARKIQYQTKIGMGVVWAILVFACSSPQDGTVDLSSSSSKGNGSSQGDIVNGNTDGAVDGDPANGYALDQVEITIEDDGGIQELASHDDSLHNGKTTLIDSDDLLNIAQPLNLADAQCYENHWTLTRVSNEEVVTAIMKKVSNDKYSAVVNVDWTGGQQDALQNTYNQIYFSLQSVVCQVGKIVFSPPGAITLGVILFGDEVYNDTVSSFMGEYWVFRQLLTNVARPYLKKVGVGNDERGLVEFKVRKSGKELLSSHTSIYHPVTSSNPIIDNFAVTQTELMLMERVDHFKTTEILSILRDTGLQFNENEKVTQMTTTSINAIGNITNVRGNNMNQEYVEDQVKTKGVELLHVETSAVSEDYMVSHIMTLAPNEVCSEEAKIVYAVEILELDQGLWSPKIFKRILNVNVGYDGGFLQACIYNDGDATTSGINDSSVSPK